MAKAIIHAPQHYDEKAVKKFINNEAIEILQKYAAYIKIYEDTLHIPVDFEKATKAFMEKHTLKMKQLAQPVRIAMVGSSVSPSVYDVLSIVGRDEVVERIEKFVKTLLNDDTKSF